MVRIFDECDEFMGTYSDMRREHQAVGKQDFPGMVDVALRFFGPLFPKRKLWGKITVQTNVSPKP